jgi:hypothetical protein
MKNVGFIALFVVIGILAYVMSRSRESFVPEFLDQGNVKRTADTRTSSYAQQTNHFQMTPSPAEKISGQETPFRVNMFNSHMV